MKRYHTLHPLQLMQIGILAVLVAAFAACSSITDPTSGTAGSGTPVPGGTSTSGTSAPCTSACSSSGGIQEATLSVEPQAGDTPEVQAIQGAKQSIQMEMYLLTERNVINALEDAANRGVNVQVMLEEHPAGSGSTSPDQTIQALNAAGVHAQGTNPQFALTHAKLMVIDGKTAYISSGNFTKSALGGSSSTTDRDFLITDTNSTDVQQCAAIFQADWARTTPQITDPNLVVSPVNARSKLTALINGAKQSLHLEEEEMEDPQIIQALTAAAGRGVQVEVVLPNSSSDDQGAQQLTQGGVKVTRVDDTNGGLYIHAKIIIADGNLAFVGSENISTQSLDQNREIGVLVANSQVIQQLEATFETDFVGTPAGS